MHNLKHNKVLHERVLVICVNSEEMPRILPERRFEIEKLSDDFTRITLRYGFMESPRVPAALAAMRKAGLKYDIMTTLFFLGGARSRKARHPKCQSGRTSSMSR